MAQVLGVGLFFIAADVPAVKAWYETVLGMALEDWSSTIGVSLPAAALAQKQGAACVFSAFPSDGTYLAPST